MRRLPVLIATGFLLLAAALAATAAAANGKGRPALPPGAVEVGEDTYFVGSRVVDGVRVDGYAFVHRVGRGRGNDRPGGGGGGGGKPKGGACYTFLANGAKWSSVEPWRTGASLGGIDMASLLAADIGTWEGSAGADVFGEHRSGPYSANLNAVDGINGAEFGPITDPGVIAVTYTWGIFGGPPQGRGLVEWDMVFDSDSFTWSTNGAPGTMDFENIATHELGHAMGLGHPSGSCTEETMYAYASTGETKKRTLNDGDIAGINALY